MSRLEHVSARREFVHPERLRHQRCYGLTSFHLCRTPGLSGHGADYPDDSGLAGGGNNKTRKKEGVRKQTGWIFQGFWKVESFVAGFLASFLFLVSGLAHSMTRLSYSFFFPAALFRKPYGSFLFVCRSEGLPGRARRSQGDPGDQGEARLPPKPSPGLIRPLRAL